MTATPTKAPPGVQTPWAHVLHLRHRDNDLARGALGAVDVFAQSLAAAGPSIAIAGTLPLAYATAGAGSLVSIALGTGIVLLVALVVAQFARTQASTGSLASYAAQGLGPWAGFASGWGLALGYTGIASACAAGTALFGADFLTTVGVTAPATATLVTLLTLALAASAVITVRGVKVSTRLALVLEGLSLAAIAAVVVLAVVHFGFHVNLEAARQTAVPSPTTIASGAVIAVTIFVGFESAGSLGLEAANPYRAIPRAIYVTAGVAGALYLVAGLVQLIAFSAGVDPTSAITPFSAIAQVAGGGWLTAVVDLSVAVSSLACTVASTTAAARILFSLSREGALPPVLGRAHATFRTPVAAILWVDALALAVPLVYVLFHVDGAAGADASGQLWASFLATAVGGTYGYLLAYLLVNISALVTFGRAGRLRPVVTAAALVSSVAIVFVAYNTFGSYQRSLPIGFAVLLGAGLAWFAGVARRDPEAAARVGSFTLVDLTGDTATDSATSTREEVQS